MPKDFRLKLVLLDRFQNILKYLNANSQWKDWKDLATKLNFGAGTTSDDEIFYGRALVGVFTVEDFCFYVFESNGSTPYFHILKSKYEIC